MPTRTRSQPGEYQGLSLSDLEDSSAATIALSLVAGYLGFGVLFYWTQTDWSLLEAFYFVTVTLSTVGFGDVTPVGHSLRLFTCGYILIGVGILGTALGEAVSSLLNVDVETPAGRILKWLSGARDEAKAQTDSNLGLSTKSDTDLLLGDQPVQSLVRTLAVVAITIGVGTVVFERLDPDLDPIDAFYYSVVTVTTVGYGDYTPQTDVGRAFVCGYALFGTILLARSLGALAALPLDRRRQYQQALVLGQYGDDLDADELDDLQRTVTELGLGTDGTALGGAEDAVEERAMKISKGEFAVAMLVRQDKCSVEDVRAVLETFDQLDADGSGELDMEDVVADADARAA